eukprot:TRINITY_DN112833_c0_g1_i1.p1 TRINITY_DN112833_c0_g1~~TRINITY_DN112833_c0_g1_i1.p1  ORF type:complete len:264 (-),score=35.81 TRINITY_DN112833_c0_g1_i1:279-1070(-)
MANLDLLRPFGFCDKADDLEHEHVSTDCGSSDSCLASDLDDSPSSTPRREVGLRVTKDPTGRFREDTLLLFDWDDTILPTSWLEERGLRLDSYTIPTELEECQLQRMAEQAAQTLETAKEYGKVVLITNAEQGWIELSCQKFMPSVYPLLQDVKLLSARSTYESQGVRSPLAWKYLAFNSEIRDFCDRFGDDQRKNILSIGDSPHEREAVIRVTDDLRNADVKAVKLILKPAVEQLLKEHEVISGCFDELVAHDGSIDLCIAP